MTMDKPRIAFAHGYKWTSSVVFKWLMNNDHSPLMVIVPGHEDDWTNVPVLYGDEFKSDIGINILKELDLDYIVCVHFPHILPPEVLAIPKKGCINLHPAYLPWNKGWHTPSWALLDGTPAGATLHFMDEGIDTGPIIARKEVKPSPCDTAHTLYAKIQAAEFELFKEAWPKIANGDKMAPVDVAYEYPGTMHHKKDLAEVQDLDDDYRGIEMIDLLRALTTNDISEAAYFIEDGRKFRVHVDIVEEA